MKTRVDERFKREAEHFRLRFACPHCAYYDEARELCSEGYPTVEHKSPSLERELILFCKLFEAV